LCVIFCCQLAVAAENALPEKALWSRNMGQSGMRRIFATGGELGELINRQVGYQVSQRLATSASRPGLPDVGHTRIDGFVAQVDSLLPFTPGPALPVSARILARSAKRFEKDKVHSRNDRLDLGILFAPSVNSFVTVGVAMENTQVDLKFVDGETSGFAMGPRLDAGVKFNDVLAMIVRMEDLVFRGDSHVRVPTPGGLLAVFRNVENHRSFVQVENIVRFTRAQLEWLPAGIQLGGMAGVHYLDTWHESQVDSQGRTVSEPFGSHERLGIFRTGVYLSKNLGNSGRWNTYGELLWDNEFDTNLHGVIDERNSGLMRLSLAYGPGPGKRLSLEYQGSWNADGTRKRNNLVFSVVLDF
jgi:hypothetical protein